MVAKIKQGQLITANNECSNTAALEQYFELVEEGDETSVYAARMNLVMMVEDKGPHGWTILGAARTLSDIIKKQKKGGDKKGRKENLRKKAEKEAKRSAKKPEKRILWFSRHNMDTDAYFALENAVYPEYRLKIIPYQARIIEGADVLRVAKQYACDAVCAVLSVDGPVNQYEELIQQADKKLDVFRPLFSQQKTGRNFSPKGSMKILSQDSYDFCGWMNMRTHKVYGAPEKKEAMK